MANKPHIYRVSGTLKFHLDEIMADDLESAKDVAAFLIKDGVDQAFPKDCTEFEVVSLDAEVIRAATKEEIED